ncbi:glycosyltransferase family 4 protein [Deinococcus yavapaiensis]|uniref:Glycosyltransferase involved in cell wall biosynthesis n=1 Tax=Deinococcus yavapaiensis KR-236 TaxID=694435 RepID=A0A318S954_9DEIO|nr:glycosyltransferase family 1 protein [Deinococcus yavapaiensis]PYE55660.1 glycosyltransferase involved in cell wall biosynthesis [Deinococcus yavapaiensis KR-236]
MNVLIDATALQSEHRARGVGAYVRELIRAIEALDHPRVRVHYLVSTVERGFTASLPTDRTIAVYRPHRPAQVYWFYNELALRHALLHVRPHVFLAPDFNGLVRNPYGKTVAVLHDLNHLAMGVPPQQKSLSLSERLSMLRWNAYHKKLRQADRILAISGNAKHDAASRLGLPETRIHVVHHGVDHERFKVPHAETASADHPPYFMHVGASNSNKNQARLLEAFALVARTHPTVRLYFAGPWMPSDLVWLEAETARLNLHERVRHLGFVASDDLPGLYANSAAFVFPSLEEGFGLPVLEAMASGAVVITSNTSALPEVAGNAALLVDPHNVKSIAEAMRRVLHEPETARRLRAAGVAHAQRFSWSETARRTLEFLESIA